MSTTHVKYLLVGGGQTSSAAVEAIRARDSEGDVMLVGQEINRPYNRKALSTSYLVDKSTHDTLFTHPADWYAANRVQLRTGRRAAHLDAHRTAVMFDDGNEVSYDKLLIATGGTPVRVTVPGSDLPGVHYVRTFEDADRLRTAIDKAKNEGRRHDFGRGRAVVIGAGLQGVELATTLTKLGIAVTITTGLAHPWGRFAGEPTGAFVTRLLAFNRVTVLSATRPTKLEGDGRVQRVIFDDGRVVDCDFVVVAMGLTPTRDILRGTAVAAERAILADDHCRTNVPDVFAAGDCAAIFDPLFGKHRLSDHWDNAVVTGHVAGTNMVGVNVAGATSASIDFVSTFTSQAFGVSLAGYGEPRFVDRRLVRGHSASDEGFVEIGVAADGRVCQVLCIGSAPCEGLEKLVANRVNVTGREEAFKDPTTEIASLL